MAHKETVNAICTQLSMGQALYSETGSTSWIYIALEPPLQQLTSQERQLSLLLQIDRMRLTLISMLGDCGLTLQCLFDVRVFPKCT